jgi:hypothetical protein
VKGGIIVNKSKYSLSTALARQRVASCTLRMLNVACCPTSSGLCTRVYPKVSGLSHNEVNNNKHLLISSKKDYGGKTH